jgi:hypothetical protein
MGKSSSIEINSGKLFNFICDNVCDDSLKKDQIKLIILRDNGYVKVYTTKGITILLDTTDIRRYQLKYLINNILHK